MRGSNIAGGGGRTRESGLGGSDPCKSRYNRHPCYTSYVEPPPLFRCESVRLAECADSCNKVQAPGPLTEQLQRRKPTVVAWWMAPLSFNRWRCRVVLRTGLGSWRLEAWIPILLPPARFQFSVSDTWIPRVVGVHGVSCVSQR